MTGYGLGVDLGTTYTAAAVRHNGHAEIARLGSRRAEIPSLVFVRPDGGVLIGEAAERRGSSEPFRLAREFKRRIGDPVPLLVGGSPYPAHALMARLLSEVLDTVTRQQEGPPSSITVTYPANWGPYKRELLGQAVRLADLGEVSLRAEPEAAAVRYAATERVRVDETVAVYDLGGGTFDAAVLRKTADGFALLGEPEGIEQLGGIDFDEAVLAHVTATLGPSVASLDPDDPSVIEALARLRRDCIEAKEALSYDTEVMVPVALPNLHTRVRLNRSEFETMITPAVLETIAALRRALRGAGVEASELRSILLSGGSSRIPLVSQLLSVEFERPVVLDPSPEHSIALGAALVSSSPAVAPSSPSSPSSPSVPVEDDPAESPAPSRRGRVATMFSKLGGRSRAESPAPSLPDLPDLPEAPADPTPLLPAPTVDDGPSPYVVDSLDPDPEPPAAPSPPSVPPAAGTAIAETAISWDPPPADLVPDTPSRGVAKVRPQTPPTGRAVVPAPPVAPQASGRATVPMRTDAAAPADAAPADAAPRPTPAPPAPAPAPIAPRPAPAPPAPVAPRPTPARPASAGATAMSPAPTATTPSNPTPTSRPTSTPPRDSVRITPTGRAQVTPVSGAPAPDTSPPPTSGPPAPDASPPPTSGPPAPDASPPPTSGPPAPEPDGTTPTRSGRAAVSRRPFSAEPPAPPPAPPLFQPARPTEAAPTSRPPVIDPVLPIPPAAMSPAARPPVSSPPVSAPPVPTRPVSVPPVSAPPAPQRPISAAPVSTPPLSTPHGATHPVSAPPAQAGFSAVPRGVYGAPPTTDLRIGPTAQPATDPPVAPNPGAAPRPTQTYGAGQAPTYNSPGQFGGAQTPPPAPGGTYGVTSAPSAGHGPISAPPAAYGVTSTPPAGPGPVSAPPAAQGGTYGVSSEQVTAPGGLTGVTGNDFRAADAARSVAGPPHGLAPAHAPAAPPPPVQPAAPPDAQPAGDQPRRRGERAVKIIVTVVVIVGLLAVAGAAYWFFVENKKEPRTQPRSAPIAQWVRKADVPLPLEGAAVAAFQGKLWVAGGQQSSDPKTKTNEVFVYDPAADEWAVGPALPKQISHATLVPTPAGLYLVGGWLVDSGSVEVLRLDGAGKVWTPQPPLPESRVNGIGGYTGTELVYAGGTRPGPSPADTVWALRRDQWVEIGKLATPRQKSMAAGNGTDTLWIMGGRNIQTEEKFGTIDLITSGGVAKSDRVIDPPVDSGAGVYVPDSGICVVGGQTPRGGFNDWWCWEGGLAQKLPALNPQRGGLNAAIIDRTVYVVGGYGKGFSSLSRLDTLTLPAR